MFLLRYCGIEKVPLRNPLDGCDIIRWLVFGYLSVAVTYHSFLRFC
jgi:hypothetical protein